MRIHTHTFLVEPSQEILAAAEDFLARELPGATIRRGKDAHGQSCVMATKETRGMGIEASITLVPVPSGTRVEYRVKTNPRNVFGKLFSLSAKPMQMMITDEANDALDGLAHMLAERRRP